MSETGTPAYVIAVCGPAGAGKSTVIEKLLPLLGDAVALRFDDYEATTIFPDLAQWVKDGADPDQLQSPQFDADVRALREGLIISPPHQQEDVGPARFLVVEEPLGRERSPMRALVDFVVYIDVPPEIALARQVLRESAHLREFIAWYLSVGRVAYQVVLGRVMRASDLVIDGLLLSEQIAAEIADALKTRQTEAESRSIEDHRGGT